MKKILVIKSSPKESSFCHALADKYAGGAKEAGSEVKVISLSKLNLEPFLKCEYTEKPTLDPDLLSAQELIAWADVLVFAYPVWWATPPALLKVFIEVIFTSGFAYKYHKSEGIMPKWDKLLAGKSARVIATMDTPPFYYKYFLGEPGFKMMKKGVLNFCGVTPVERAYYGSVKMASDEKRKQWLEEEYKAGLSA